MFSFVKRFISTKNVVNSSSFFAQLDRRLSVASFQQIFGVRNAPIDAPCIHFSMKPTTKAQKMYCMNIKFHFILFFKFIGSSVDSRVPDLSFHATDYLFSILWTFAHWKLNFASSTFNILYRYMTQNGL